MTWGRVATIHAYDNCQWSAFNVHSMRKDKSKLDYTWNASTLSYLKEAYGQTFRQARITRHLLFEDKDTSFKLTDTIRKSTRFVLRLQSMEKLDKSISGLDRLALQLATIHVFSLLGSALWS